MCKIKLSLFLLLILDFLALHKGKNPLLKQKPRAWGQKLIASLTQTLTEMVGDPIRGLNRLHRASLGIIVLLGLPLLHAGSSAFNTCPVMQSAHFGFSVSKTVGSSAHAGRSSRTKLFGPRATPGWYGAMHFCCINQRADCLFLSGASPGSARPRASPLWCSGLHLPTLLMGAAALQQHWRDRPLQGGHCLPADVQSPTFTEIMYHLDTWS